MRAVVRAPLVVLLPVAVVRTARLVDAVRSPDTAGFIRAGRAVLSPAALDVFADPWLQVGPVLVVVMGVWAVMGEVMGVSPFLLAGAAHGALVVWLGDVVTRRWVPAERDPTAARWAVGLALVLGGLMERSFTPGHEEDLVIVLAMAAAATAAARARPVRLGLLLALGFGLKAWAVLGGGLVLAGRRAGRTVLAAAVAAGTVLGMYAPFVLWGEVNTLEFSWGIQHGASLLGDLARAWGLSDWGLRVVQAAVAGLAGAAVALRRHAPPLAAVVVAVGVRLLLEPHLLYYYCSPFLLLTVLWAWTSPTVRRTWPRMVVLAGVPVFLGHSYFVGAAVLQVTEALLYAGGITWVLLAERRPRRGVASCGPTEPPPASSWVPAGRRDER